MSGKVWLEVALNGSWTRARQPNIPVTADEIVEEALACIDAGASVVHFHAYDPERGRQRDTYEHYAPTIARIRERRDAIVYPTVPYASRRDGGVVSAEARFAELERMAAAGLLEWVSVDPGSTNLSTYADVRAGREGFVYLNPEGHVRHGLALAARFALTASYAIYEPGFVRLGAALHRARPDAPQPVYRLMFSDEMTFGFPVDAGALDAYVRLLAREAPGAPWMIAGLQGDVAPLIAQAVAAGGHIRVGLEDAPLGEGRRNVELVREAVRMIEAAGGVLASAADIRAGHSG